MDTSPFDGTDFAATWFGATVAVGLVHRLNRRFFLETQGQAGLVIPMDIGPVGITCGHGTSPYGTLPRTRMNFSHAAASVGLGVRI